MIDSKIKSTICQKGRELQDSLPDFFGKIVLNYSNGKFIIANIEQSIKDDNPNEGRS
jgi:hypothetical protein